MALQWISGNFAHKGTDASSALARLFIANEGIANFGDATGLRPSATAGNLYVALHTAEPYTGDAQDSNEADYVGYARAAIARASVNWARDGFDTIGNISNTATNPRTNACNQHHRGVLYFPKVQAYSGGGASDALITHLSLGTDLIGAGLLMYVCELDQALQLDVGRVPALTNIHVGEG